MKRRFPNDGALSDGIQARTGGYSGFAPYLLAGGSITPEKCLLLLVSSFMIYAAVEVAGSMSSIARAVEASLDRLDNIMDIPSLDENGADLVPEIQY